MKQIGSQKFTTEDSKLIVICENDMSLGEIHDYLLELKGTVVEMISAAQKQEQDAADKIKEIDANKAEEVEVIED